MTLLLKAAAVLVNTHQIFVSREAGLHARSDHVHVVFLWVAFIMRMIVAMLRLLSGPFLVHGCDCAWLST